jgi:hypothetical protein
MNKVCQFAVSISLAIVITLGITCLMMGIVAKIEKAVEHQHKTHQKLFKSPYDAE